MSMWKLTHRMCVPIAALLLVSTSAAAHRWNMRTFAFERGTNAAACAALVLNLADRVNSSMGEQGYTMGKIASGLRAVRLDGVGYPTASLYLYCSEYSMYIFTSHSPVDDDTFFSDLYNTMLREFTKIRGH